MSTSTNPPAAQKSFKLGRRGRRVLGVALAVAFLLSLIWIWLGSPLPLKLLILLAVVAGGSLTAFRCLFVSKDLPKH